MNNITRDYLQLQRIRWQCRRGMLELDVLLQKFFDQHYQQLSPIDQINFEKLLTSADQDLYRWLLGHGRCEDGELLKIVERIRFST